MENKILDLTEEEFEILSSCHFDIIFDQIKDQLSKAFKEEFDPVSRYDVQEDAKRFMRAFMKKKYEPFNPLKTFAFETGINYGKILKAAAIPLRDYYLQEHPEITL